VCFDSSTLCFDIVCCLACFLYINNIFTGHCLTYPTGDDKVTPNSFGDIVTRYASLWREIGLKLGLEISVLDNIEADCPQQRKRLEKILDAWLKLDQDNATWGALELAITNANRAELGLEPLSDLAASKICVHNYAVIAFSMYTVHKIADCIIPKKSRSELERFLASQEIATMMSIVVVRACHCITMNIKIIAAISWLSFLSSQNFSPVTF